MPRFQFTIPLIVEALNEDGSIEGNPVRHEMEVTGSADTMQQAIAGFEEQFSHALARSASNPAQSKEAQKNYDEMTARYIKQIGKTLEGLEKEGVVVGAESSHNALKDIGVMLQIAKEL